MHRRTGDRHHQRDTRLPPVLLAWDLGGGGRVVSGLFGIQSQALPYLILGVMRGPPSRSLGTISVPVLPPTAFLSVTPAYALTDTAPTGPPAITLIPLS